MELGADMEKIADLEVIKQRFFSNTENLKYKVHYLFMGFHKSNESIDTISRQIFILTQNALVQQKFQIVTEDDDFLQYKLIVNGSELEIKISHEINEEQENLWEVEIYSDFIQLATYRKLFLAKSNELFSYKYCLKDDISNEICRKSYPLINELENKLREYLLGFFIKKVGSKWWKFNSNDALIRKSNKPKREFNEFLNMEIYNIDFVDLKELVTGNFPKLSQKDILQVLDGIEQTKDDPNKVSLKINKLRENYLGNWEKFFAQHIDIDDFKNIWQKLYEIRCSVCHNSLVTLNNFCDLVEYHELIIRKLSLIIDNMDNADLSRVEAENISELSENLNHILGLNIKFSSEDIIELIQSSVLYVGKNNFVEQPVANDSFISLFESYKNELSIFGDVEECILQADHEDIPPMYYIRFKQIDDKTLSTLDYGIRTKSFS